MKESVVARIGIWMSAMLSPILPMIWAMQFLIFTDFVTGIYAAWKNKEPIQSAKMGRTATKFLFYTLLLISGFVFETYFVPEVPFARVAGGYIAMTEIRSIYENANKIFGINIWEQVKHMINKK